MLTKTFRSLAEERPGPGWDQVFRHGWPGWREWFVLRGGGDQPSLHDAERMLQRHMPEFAPVWRDLVDATGAGEDAARFLSFWQPPRYLVNCSQMAIVDRDGPLLLRNYDLDPTLNEATVFKTRWKHREVIGLVEGMAGLADGMNRSGLAMSLAFGGRAICGHGFGIPLIIRYVLEVCANVGDALEALRAVPCHMAYNVTLIDRSGAKATAMLAPDHPPIVSHENAYATNHQLGVEWPRHGRLTRTVERADRLRSLNARQDLEGETLRQAFLSRPVFSDRYAEGFGTVYTAAYRPASGEVTLFWPSQEPWHLSFDAFPEEMRRVSYSVDAKDAAANGEDPAHLDAFRRRNQVIEEQRWTNLNGAVDLREEGHHP